MKSEFSVIELLLQKVYIHELTLQDKLLCTYSIVNNSLRVCLDWGFRRRREGMVYFSF